MQTILNRRERRSKVASTGFDYFCSFVPFLADAIPVPVRAQVNHQPLSRSWGGGTLSSSDGQRFPVSAKLKMATALPRYFGYGKGVTFYTWTADQFSQ